MKRLDCDKCGSDITHTLPICANCVHFGASRCWLNVATDAEGYVNVSPDAGAVPAGHEDTCDKLRMRVKP